MKNLFGSVVRLLMHQAGVDLVRHRQKKGYPRDFDAISQEICQAVRPYTLTNVLRINALVTAVQYVVQNGIDGAFVECGVWKGGSSMAMALTLQKLGMENREIYLYDTFTGMSAPTAIDVAIDEAVANRLFEENKESDSASGWWSSPVNEVRENLSRTGYREDKLHFVEGKVEDTIPGTIPEEIALLRLDTDWYESTRHEMMHLFPRLKKGGVLIVDDYGHWLGARKAVDEYIRDNNVRILLNRIDYTARIAIKLE